MQIREDVYNWLVSLKIITNDGKKYIDKVEVSKPVVVNFENGNLFSKLLKELHKLYTRSNNRPETPLSKLQSLKEVNSAASRLYNWNILVEEYIKVGIKIDQDTKALILSGDTEMMHELLKEIYALSASWGNNNLRINQSNADLGLSKLNIEDSMSTLRTPGQKSQSTKILAQNKISNVQQQVDLSRLDPKKDLNRTQNCLEFFIVALAKHLQLTTKQAASLFTNNNKYLAHVIAKGVKGIFEPIVAFYQEIYANQSQLMKLFIEDQTKKSIVFSLQALKAGLISKSYEVAQLTARLFSKLAQDFVENNQILLAWDWFLNEEGGGLHTSLMGIKRHPDLRETLVDMILQFARFNFVEVFTNGLKKAQPEIKDLMNTIEQLFKPLSENKLSRDEIFNSGILEEWINLGLSTAEGEFKNPTDVRIAALSFLSEVWMVYPQKIEEFEHRANTLIQLLKKTSRDKSQSLALCSLNNLFKLLNYFGNSRNPYAPIIYKNISLSLVENHQNSVTREFILQNFITTFQQQESIPFNILIEPLIKQVQVSDNVSYILNTFDMQFFQQIANSDRLGVKNAIQLLDLLAKVFLNNSVYSATSQDIILTVLSKHIENTTMQEFIIKFIKISLAMFYASEKKKEPREKMQAINYLHKKNHEPVQQNSNPGQEREVLQAQKRAQIVEIIRTIVQLQQALLNEKIKPLVAHTNIQIKQFTKKNSKGMVVILSLFGNSDKIIEKYEIEFLEHQARLNLDSQINDEDQVVSQVFDNQNQSIRSSGEAMKYGMITGKNKSQKHEQYQLASLKQSKADPKVLNELESIKKSFMEKIHTKVCAVEDQKEQLEKQNTQLRKQLQLRGLEQGVSNLNKKDQEVQLLFKDGIREKELSKEKKHGPPEFDLIDLDFEEDREKFMVEMVFRRFNKILKYLFIKYANTGHTNKKFQNFNEYQDKSATISVPEIWLFIKNFQLDVQVSREEIPALMRSIFLQIMKDKTELQVFYYDGFKSFLVQFSILVYGHTERNLKKYLSPSLTIQKLFKHMRTVAASSQQSTQLYDDPDQQYFQESEVIKEYNKELSTDPKFPLPEGYKAVQEPKLDFKYSLINKIQLSEAQKFSYEALNDILFEMFQFYLIEPTTVRDTILLCRPNILGNVQSKVKDRLSNGPLYMDYEKEREKKQEGQKQIDEVAEQKRLEWEQSIRDRAKEREKQKQEGIREKADPKYTKLVLERYTQSADINKINKQRNTEFEPFHQLTLGTKLGISKMPYKDKGIAEQVAIVLDDIIFAVETNRHTISRNIPIMNKAKLLKEKEKQINIVLQEKSDQKFRKRADLVKLRLDQLKKKKVDDEQQNKELKSEIKKDSTTDKKKEIQDKRKKHFTEIKTRIQNQEKKNDSDRQKQAIEDNSKHVAELEQKKKKFVEFNEQKKTSLKEKNVLKKQLQEQIEEKIKAKEDKDKTIMEKLYQGIEKKGEQIKQKEKETQDIISARFNEASYQDVYKKANFKLSFLFELLQMEIYKPIEYADIKENITLKLWMWLGERFRIYPEIIKRFEYIRVFNWITHKKHIGKIDKEQGKKLPMDKKDQDQATKDLTKSPNVQDQTKKINEPDYELLARTKHPKYKAPIGLNYNEFLQALLRVSIKGCNVFNQIALKLKEDGKVSKEQIHQILDEEKNNNEGDIQDQIQETPKTVKRSHQSKDQMLKEIKKEILTQNQRLEEVESKKREEAIIEKKALLIDNYKYIQDSNTQTLDALIYYLELPEDKVGIELRFRVIMEENVVHMTDRDRKKELLAKMEQDLEKWQSESKLIQSKSPIKQKRKPIKITDQVDDKQQVNKNGPLVQSVQQQVNQEKTLLPKEVVIDQLSAQSKEVKQQPAQDKTIQQKPVSEPTSEKDVQKPEKIEQI